MHIGRVVLDGIDVAAAERPRLKAAIETELARIIAERGIAGELRQGIAVPALRTPQIAAAKPAQLGTAIAGAVGATVGGERR
jgi:hypothetical protein